MRALLSGGKRSYYGKGETVVYRLHKDRDAESRNLAVSDRVHGTTPRFRHENQPPVLCAKITMVIWGEAFWPTYTTGDNTNLVATDSMKNFVQRETLNYPGDGFEGLIHFLGTKFLEKYPQAEGIELMIEEVPFEPLQGGVGFQPSGGARMTAQVWLEREVGRVVVRDLVSGLVGYQLLRITGSAFTGFVRDEYTTLPEMKDRPLRMFLEAQWRYANAQDGVHQDQALAAKVNGIITSTFQHFESGSIQQVIYLMGQNILRECPSIEVVELEGQNHTWDMVVDGGQVGVFTVAKPFYGILGVKVTRADLST